MHSLWLRYLLESMPSTYICIPILVRNSLLVPFLFFWFYINTCWFVLVQLMVWLHRTKQAIYNVKEVTIYIGTLAALHTNEQFLVLWFLLYIPNHPDPRMYWCAVVAEVVFVSIDCNKWYVHICIFIHCHQCLSLIVTLLWRRPMLAVRVSMNLHFI
jgi:hypothetical protein